MPEERTVAVAAPPATEAELGALARALRLAARGRYGTPPNPMVGAVLLRGETIVGEGWHRQVGGPHAETAALQAAGEAARGATLCVTLEPCAHHGRTPPCADAVVAAGVRRVVACHRDPDPRVAGSGFARLRDAGVEVVLGHLLEDAVALGWKYLTAKVLDRPAVTLKWAMSLDGRIATRTGDSRWITGERARRWSLGLRETHDAILVGSGTALADDPLLTRRLGRAAGPITRVVLDRRLRLSPAARLLGEAGPVLVYTEAVGGSAAAALEANGAEVVAVAAVNAPAVLADLHRRGIQSVLVEGGGEVLAAFAAAGLFDRVEVAVAPLLVGGREAPAPLGGRGPERLAEALKLDGPTVERRGDDLILGAFRSGCLPVLYASVGG
jgi:diaminohydroxyphosphoribosylaminopyrimidine deaminase / 5-amino-6-(5-phosphoribosylamino)uracil reductase